VNDRRGHHAVKPSPGEVDRGVDFPVAGNYNRGMNALTPAPSGDLAVLVSGGLDSAILLGEAVGEGRTVHPLYVRTGLRWESVELEYLNRFLTAIRGWNLRPLHILEQPIRDVYGDHWSTTGEGIPDYDSPDEAVFLPGRNVLLLAKALLWCHLQKVPAIAMAPLQANPFPDATDEFFAEFGAAVNRAVGGSVQILRPYASLSKVEVLHRGSGMPLHETFSCIHPVRGLHCGRCNKCAERRKGFQLAQMIDPTRYSE
jgi:7-cyano-7-deazaguanine synthase